MRNRVIAIAVATATLLSIPAAAALAGVRADPVKEGIEQARETAEPAVEPVVEPVGALAEAAFDDQVVAGSPGVQAGGGASQGFVNYPVPESNANAHTADEPSIGVDAGGRALLLLSTAVARASFDDTTFPAGISWDDATPPTQPPTNIDPLLYTDRSTYRTFNAQLEGVASYGAITDDGGDTWTTTAPPTAAPSFDHQSIGAGPYPAGSNLSSVGYPNAAYYCAQGGVFTPPGSGNSFSQCSRSDDGGLTWGAPVPIQVAQCGGLHGKVVVDPSGNVFVPNRSCPDGDPIDSFQSPIDLPVDRPIPPPPVRRQGVIVSHDAGNTWAPVLIPKTTESHGDPAITFDAAGTAYFAGNADGHPVVSVSHDGGTTWADPIDVGAPFGVQNNEFSMAVAGDAGRAAVAFLGTPTAGDDQAATFTGAWHVFESFTIDGGVSWSTVDVTPTDPVQRGCIWMGGGSNPCRNLLDFDGMTADPAGRVLIGYADGCTGPCAGPSGTPAQSRDTLGVIARQEAGPRLVAADDPAPTQLYISTGGPYSTTAGTPVVLAASTIGGTGTYAYAWDLDGDGVFESPGASVPFTSDTPGSHGVTVQVTDDGGTVATAPATVEVQRGATELAPLVQWGFDGPAGACDEQGWTTFDLAIDPTGDTPEVQTEKWHLVASKAASPACAWSHGIDGADTYPSLQYTTMESPCVDLTDVAAAQLAFSYAGELEQGDDGTQYDTMRVGVGTCGGTDFTELARYGGKAGDLDAATPQYVTSTIDLAAYAGQQVRLVFEAHSDEITEMRGYQVDDIKVLAG